MSIAENQFSVSSRSSGPLRNACAARLLPLLLLCTLPAVVQAQFTYSTNKDGTLNIRLYTGTNAVVTIPSSTNGLSVTGIGASAFFNCTSLTNVTICAVC
jgi:hypothetical protein